MSKKTGYLFGMFLTIGICMILAWFFCCNDTIAATETQDQKGRTETQNPKPLTTTASVLPFSLVGPDGKFSYESEAHFNFNTSAFDVITPVSREIDMGIEQLKIFFDSEGNANKRLDITGLYSSDEENSSAFANLGLARANVIKNYFVNKGIKSARINTFGALDNSLVPDSLIYKGPVQYRLFSQAEADRISESNTINQTLNAVKDNPLVLNFEYGEAAVTLSEEQRYKIGDISRYLDKVEGSSILIEGHTDGKGTHTTNDRLGLDRAEFAKAYLVNNGIPAAKIKTIAIGKRKPIASNETEAGRKQNRRAVVTIN